MTDSVEQRKYKYENSGLRILMESEGHEICPRCYCCDFVLERETCWACGGMEDDDPDVYVILVCSECNGEGEITVKVCMGSCDENGNHALEPMLAELNDLRHQIEYAQGAIGGNPSIYVHDKIYHLKNRAEAAEQALREAQAELAEWRRSETWKEWKALCDQNAESVRKALKLHDDAKAENEKLRDVCRAKPSQDSATPAQDNPKSKTKKKHYHVDLGDFQ